MQTCFQLTPGVPRLRRTFADEQGTPLLTLEACPQASLWRINHGWRRSSGSAGFTIDLTSGRWSSADGADDMSDARSRLQGIKPYVSDTRNLLFVTVADAARQGNEAFLKTLGYALRRAMQVLYQVEEQEIVVEIIGEGTARRLLFWESAEGGIGVAERLLVDGRALQDIAQRARQILHVDPDSGRPTDNACPAACYECLLSYANQIDHRLLDRRLVLEFLADVQLARSDDSPSEESYEDQYRRLLRHLDPGSSLEHDFVEALFARNWRLPDLAQHCPARDVAVQVDFFYRTPVPGLCVFVDGAVHDTFQQKAHDDEVRSDLEDRGFRIVAIRHDQEIDVQLDALCRLFFH